MRSIYCDNMPLDENIIYTKKDEELELHYFNNTYWYRIPTYKVAKLGDRLFIYDTNYGPFDSHTVELNDENEENFTPLIDCETASKLMELQKEKEIQNVEQSELNKITTQNRLINQKASEKITKHAEKLKKMEIDFLNKRLAQTKTEYAFYEKTLKMVLEDEE